MSTFERLDAGESIFFTRELETIRRGTYDVKFEEPKLLNIIPIGTEGDPLATDITHRSYSRVGIAKMGGGDYATDFPRVDVYGIETTVKVHQVQDSYGYNRDEIARAAKVGRPLEAMRASAARKAIEMKLDQIARSGDALTGAKGLYNAVGINTFVTVDGAASTTTWATKTSDEILADMNGIVNFSITATNGIETPDTLALPMAQYMLISQKRLSNETEKTILQYFKEVNPYITNVIWLNGLSTAGTQGVTDSTAQYMCWKNSPDKLVFDLPMPFTQEPVIQDGLAFIVPCRAKTAGVTVFYPLSVTKSVGI